MSLILSGDNGVSDIDGSAATPAIRGADANTGMFFGTDIVGLSTGGAERLRIDSSGNVGIGTSSPLEKLQVAGPVVSTANLAALRASTMTMDYISGGRLIATGADSSTYSPIIFGTATTTTFAERGRFEANGNLKLALNLSVGSATPTTSGTGITFPATQSASSDANTLDDYEEGSWTPSLGGNTTYSVQSGTYVKIGKVVTVNFSLTIATLGTGSVNTISGLPFSSAVQGTGLVGYFNNLLGAWGSLGFFTEGTTLRNISITTGSSGQSVDRGIFGNGTRIDGCSITYIV